MARHTLRDIFPKTFHGTLELGPPRVQHVPDMVVQFFNLLGRPPGKIATFGQDSKSRPAAFVNHRSEGVLDGRTDGGLLALFVALIFALITGRRFKVPQRCRRW